MRDRIVLSNMRFDARHGYFDRERRTSQPFEVDVELHTNLQPAGVDDDLEQTVDYGRVYDIVKDIVESTSYKLLEALAEAISGGLLTGFAVDFVVVRVRKPQVQLGGPLDHAAVEIRRTQTRP